MLSKLSRNLQSPQVVKQGRYLGRRHKGKLLLSPRPIRQSGSTDEYPRKFRLEGGLGEKLDEWLRASSTPNSMNRTQIEQVGKNPESTSNKYTIPNDFFLFFKTLTQQQTARATQDSSAADVTISSNQAQEILTQGLCMLQLNSENCFHSL